MYPQHLTVYITVHGDYTSPAEKFSSKGSKMRRRGYLSNDSLSTNMILLKHLSLTLGPSGLIILLLKQLNRNIKHEIPIKSLITLIIIAWFPIPQREKSL